MPGPTDDIFGRHEVREHVHFTRRELDVVDGLDEGFGLELFEAFGHDGLRHTSFGLDSLGPDSCCTRGFNVAEYKTFIGGHGLESAF